MGLKSNPYTKDPIFRAGLTMVPNVPWHRAPRCNPPPAPRRKKDYLIVIYIGNQITDIYATRYDTSMGYWVYYTRATSVMTSQT